MNLYLYKELFKEIYDWKYKISIGKTDKNEEYMITFYNSKRQSANKGFFDTKEKDSQIKKVTILLRAGRNARTAEEIAEGIQKFFNSSKALTIAYEEKNIHVIPVLQYSEPIFLGTDENGIYEYSYEIDFIENKPKEDL